MFPGNGNYTPSPRQGAGVPIRSGTPSTIPRLPPIVLEDRYQGQSAMALIDRTYSLQSELLAASMDERHARQILEEQVRVITAVCKKLNSDVEALDGHMNEKNYLLNSLEMRTNDLAASNMTLNKELQFKMTQHDSFLSKLESSYLNLTTAIKDVQMQLQDHVRSSSMRMSAIESRLNDLNNKFDSVLTEQTMVLKSVEGDSHKQISMLDGRTRTMLEDIRGQIAQMRQHNDSEMTRMETRLAARIDDGHRNQDRYDRFDARLEEYSQSMNKRIASFEDEYQRALSKMLSLTDQMEYKVNRGIDERYSRYSGDIDKLKRDLKVGFENVQESIVTLQRVTDGKIKISEDKLEKEIDKIRKMVVLI